MLRLQSKALRTVLWWQVVATAVLAGVAQWLADGHGAISAALGGLTSITAGVVAGLVMQRGGVIYKKTAAEMLVIAMTAEGIRIGLMMGLLWLVFVKYDKVMPGWLIGTFIVTVLIFSMAFFVRENAQQSS